MFQKLYIRWQSDWDAAHRMHAQTKIPSVHRLTPPNHCVGLLLDACYPACYSVCPSACLPASRSPLRTCAVFHQAGRRCSVVPVESLLSVAIPPTPLLTQPPTYAYTLSSATHFPFYLHIFQPRVSHSHQHSLANLQPGYYWFGMGCW